MNEIVKKFSLASDKFMPKMHLIQPGFTYSACGPLTKNKERIQKFKETGDTSYIYKNELDMACFQHDMAYGDFKDLERRTASDKVLRDKANIAKNPKYDGHQRGLASVVYNFFDKKSKGSGVNMLLEFNENQLKNYSKQLLEISKKEQFKYNIWGAYLADIQLISKFNKGFRCLL